MRKLPEKFTERMREMLSNEEYESFLESYEKEPKKGVRANALKIDREQLLERLPSFFKARPVSWSPDGLYIDNEVRPGKQPEYYTGLYYPQEPSAMSSAEALEVIPGDTVLDLCASPGGKSTQLASKLGGMGTLVLNEVVKSRLGALSSNVERMGIKNAVILNETPDRLARSFPEMFDKILVDAPCSGEGMFRKDPEVIDEWGETRPISCSVTQKKILKSVDQLLKPGGEIVYSTCTFAPEENEQIVEYLADELGYEVCQLDLDGIETTGNPEYGNNGLTTLTRTVRIWPHHSEGEGHFIARLKKPGKRATTAKGIKRKKNNHLVKSGKKRLIDFSTFVDEYLIDYPIDWDRLYLHNDILYQLPEGIVPDMLTGLKVKSPGLQLGTLKKNRFEPSQALAMSLSRSQYRNVYDLSEEELWAYLKGEEIKPRRDVEKGWVLLCYEGYPVGFSKMSSALKNKYPKGLRIYKK